MAIPHDTVVELNNEGIVTVEDLADFDRESLKQVADNLRRPGGRIPDPTPGATRGATIPKPPFVFGSKSQTRLGVACQLIRFYEMIDRPLTATNLRWNPVMRRFKEIWEAIELRKKADGPDTPVISKALPIMRWTEAFTDHLHRCVGDRLIPLAYVIRKDVTVDPTCPPLALDQPYSELHGSVDADMINRASHTHGLYRDDNASVYYKLEEATRSTPYADSIKPFQRSKDGRGAFIALTNQYAGVDKWEAEIKKQSHLLHTRKWKGQSNYTLERFIQSHRNAFVSMQACTQHVPYQLPNELTRVRYLLDAIENDDAGLQAAMAGVEQDTGAGGMRSDFEKAAAHLLPKDPVVKKRLASSKRAAAEISAATAVVNPKTKKGIGSTGVHLRYYKPDEYSKLTKAQKRELSEWRKNKASNEKNSATTTGPSNPKRKRSKLIAAIDKQLVKKLQEATDANEKITHEEVGAYIMSLIKKGGASDGAQASGTAAVGATVKTPASSSPQNNPVIEVGNSSLAAILNRAKKAQGCAGSVHLV